MYSQESKEYVLNILEHEPIRYCDGRYSDGFKDIGMLTEMISDGVAEEYDKNGVHFVRRTGREYRYPVVRRVNGTPATQRRKRDEQI
jgi:hypothetical protein